MWDSIKDNWAQITVLGAIIVILGGAYMEYRIGKNVNDAFKAASLVNPAVVEANTESIEDLEKEAEKLDSKIERIVDILLEE